MSRNAAWMAVSLVVTGLCIVRYAADIALSRPGQSGVWAGEPGAEAAAPPDPSFWVGEALCYGGFAALILTFGLILARRRAALLSLLLAAVTERVEWAISPGRHGDVALDAGYAMGFHFLVIGALIIILQLRRQLR